MKIRNDYEPVESEATSWRLPDLAFASEAWALLECEIPAVEDSEKSGSIPITVSVQAAMRESSPLFLMAALPPLPVMTAAHRRALPVDELVARRTLELAAAEALEEVRVAIEADNWERAKRLIDDAATRFGAHEWAAAILATMRRLVGERDKWLAMKEASFSRPVDEPAPGEPQRGAVLPRGRAFDPFIPAPGAGAGQGAARNLSAPCGWAAVRRCEPCGFQATVAGPRFEPPARHAVAVPLRGERDGPRSRCDADPPRPLPHAAARHPARADRACAAVWTRASRPSRRRHRLPRS